MTRVPAGMALACLLAIARGSVPSEAHKPITSPFTYNEHVFPILKQHCGACHVAGGVAPMSLMTHAETVPWGESIRLELIAGHMPPWSTPGLSARELNTLLTWASGGTPPGDEATAPPPVTLENDWDLGRPDDVFALPEFTMSESMQEHVAAFVARAGHSHLRAIDLRPGNPAIVRSATITTRDGFPLLLWQPGDAPRALEGAAFRIAPGSELVVRIRYRKTWEYERKAMTDRSEIGFYVRESAAPAVERLTVPPGGRVLDRDIRVLAITPDPSLGTADVTVTSTAANTTPATLTAFRTVAGWTRRHWLDRPVSLPRGTRIEATASVALDIVGN